MCAELPKLYYYLKLARRKTEFGEQERAKVRRMAQLKGGNFLR